MAAPRRKNLRRKGQPVKYQSRMRRFRLGPNFAGSLDAREQTRRAKRGEVLDTFNTKVTPRREADFESVNFRVHRSGKQEERAAIYTAWARGRPGPRKEAVRARKGWAEATS